MSSKTVALDLDSANLLWLEARATASGKRDLSEILNEMLAQLRTGGRTGAVRSVRGTIRLPGDDPDLAAAQKAVRKAFNRSIEQTGGDLAQAPEIES